MMTKPLKIFSSEQIRKADSYTIQHLPISSIDLMEKAASVCTEWICRNYDEKNSFHIFCGPGNNGGDGLAIARLLLQKHYHVKVYILRFSDKYSEDFLTNESRLNRIWKGKIVDIDSVKNFPSINEAEIIIDALFGNGLTRPVSGLASDCINHMNDSGAKIISIDLPSGLYSDRHSLPGSSIIKAGITLSFQFPKLAFMFSENAKYVGRWEVLEIGLCPNFILNEPSKLFYLTKDFITSIIRNRGQYSHKGTFGHAMIIAGSYGKMGAAVLAVRSCLRSGVGLVTAYVPACGYEILQITAPEAMAEVDSNEKVWSSSMEVNKFSALGIGPGIGIEPETQKSFEDVLRKSPKYVVLDADALNILSQRKDLLKEIPQGAVLTPHVKEFERLTGKAENNFERHAMQLAFSKEYKVYVVLKGAHSVITTPEGDSYFNSTGNPGMAKGGSGDVLTGLLTGLLAQGYDPIQATLLGVYLHGLAGDVAKSEKGEESMTADDIINGFSEAFESLKK